MSKEYMQALYDLFGLVAFQKSLTKEQYARLQKYNDIIEQALQRLESIDNAKPSEALECLEGLATHRIEYREPFEFGFSKTMPFKSTKEFQIIKYTLLKAQEQEKENAKYKRVLEIIKEKNVDIYKIKKFIKLDVPKVYNLNYYNEHLWKRKHQKKLTDDEFDLLKRWLG